MVFGMAACSPTKPLPKAVCDLTASPCVLSIKDQSLQAAKPDEPWLLRLTHEPVAGDSHEVRLQLTVNGRLDRVNAIMQGESMYMGEYPILFRLLSTQTEAQTQPQPQPQPQVWQAVFRMPVCTTSHAMLWRIRLAVSRAQQHDTADILFQE